MKQEAETRGGAGEPKCPCGCDSALRRYNGVQAVSCITAWQTLPEGLKAAIMLGHGDERDEAIREAEEILTRR